MKDAAGAEGMGGMWRGRKMRRRREERERIDGLGGKKRQEAH